MSVIESFYLLIFTVNKWNNYPTIFTSEGKILSAPSVMYLAKIFENFYIYQPLFILNKFLLISKELCIIFGKTFLSNLLPTNKIVNMFTIKHFLKVLSQVNNENVSKLSQLCSRKITCINSLFKIVKLMLDVHELRNRNEMIGVCNVNLSSMSFRFVWNFFVARKKYTQQSILKH